MKLNFPTILVIGCVFLANLSFAESEESFTRTLLPQLQAEIQTHKFEYVAPLEIHDSTSGQQIYLDRIYGYAAANPKEASAAIRSFVSKTAKALVDADKPIAEQDIRLAVRNGSMLKKSLEAMGPGPRAAFPRVLAGELVVVPVIDTPSMVKYISDRNLAIIGLTEEQVIQLGTKNLQAMQKPMATVAKIPPKSGIGIIAEEYAASRLIFIQEWKPIADKVGGNLVAMAPAYDTVIYGDGSTLVAVDALRTIGLEMAKRSQVPLASTIVRFKEDHWEVVK